MTPEMRDSDADPPWSSIVQTNPREGIHEKDGQDAQPSSDDAEEGETGLGTNEEPDAALGWPALGFALLIGTLLALLMHWPLPLHLDRDVVDLEFGDPLLQAWQVAWGGHALLTEPLSFFDSNTFWPLTNSLAFSDALLGYAPAGLLGDGPIAALVRYNVLFLFAYALSFAGAYLLARELRVAAIAASVAGAAFAYAPWRIAQNTHLHVISSGGIPLALFMLLRGYRRHDPRLIIGGWVVAAWQVSLGFTLGLQLAYLLAGLVIVLGVLTVRGRKRPQQSLLVATAIGMLIFGGWASLQARPYLQVVNTHPEARRMESEILFYSPPPVGLLTAPEENSVWGKRTEGLRETLPWPSEQTLFPGLIISALALGGLATSTFSKRLRIGLLMVAILTTILSLGLRGPAGGFAYRILYQLPGWEGIRTPGRLNTITSLAVALLAAAGVHALLRDGRSREKGTFRFQRVTVIGAMIVGAILMEGSGDIRLSVAPGPPPITADAPQPQLHLPSDHLKDPVHMYWSTDGFPEIVNGHSGFIPESLAALRTQIADFPDQHSVALLYDYGVRSVVVHQTMALGTPWEGATAKPVEGLPLVREQVGDLMIYRLEAP